MNIVRECVKIAKHFFTERGILFNEQEKKKKLQSAI